VEVQSANKYRKSAAHEHGSGKDGDSGDHQPGAVGRPAGEGGWCNGDVEFLQGGYEYQSQQAKEANSSFEMRE
jgi:hypothetical protein